MANSNLTPSAAHLEEALTVLFCLIDDAYDLLNPSGSDAYSSLKRLSDSEVLTLALFQQLRGLESERSFLRDAQRFFSHLFPGVVVGLHPSSLHRRVRKLRRGSSSVFWNPCGGTSSTRWSATRRLCSSTPLCFRFCTPGRSLRARASPGRRG